MTSSAIIQFMLFGCVGATGTVIDVGIYNLLTRPSVGWRRIPASSLSVSGGMVFNFFANWLMVFRPSGNHWLGMAGRYLVITSVSAFILQNLVIYLTTRHWLLPASMAIKTVRIVRLQHRFDDDFVSRNTSKAVAIATGMVWNFCWYKYFVYVV